MSAINDAIVRDYFEGLGFFVHQPRKYAVSARPKRADEEIDLFIHNPLVTDTVISQDILWGSKELLTLQHAIVGIRGWHSDRIGPSVLEESPEIFRFVSEESVRSVARMLPGGRIAKILCLPELSASEPLRRRTLDILRERGVDGVVLFPTMLHELIQQVDTNKLYERSDVLQMLRILKSYDLLKNTQLELFKNPRRKRTKKMPDE